MSVTKQEIPNNALMLDSYLLALAKNKDQLNNLPTLILFLMP